MLAKLLRMKQKYKGGFLGILAGILGSNLLGNLLTSKGVMRASEGTIKVGQDL